MHLRNVEIFCDTVSHRSFSKAAELRGISQPTVSQAIHQLEEKLGVALFDRSQRPLELTQAGRVFHDGCRKLLSWSMLRFDVLMRLSASSRFGVTAATSAAFLGSIRRCAWSSRHNTRWPTFRLCR